MIGIIKNIRAGMLRRMILGERYSSMRIEQIVAEMGRWLHRSKYEAKFSSERAYCSKMVGIYRKRLEWYIKNY